MLGTKELNISNKFTIGGKQQFTFIAGPCAIENRDMVFETAETLKKVCEELKLNFVFKASFDKANRSSTKNARGVGIDAGLKILQEVKNQFDLPIITDVHESWQCEPVAQVADILQIPAFLCRQTDLLVAAAKTGKIINVKKGQFLAPWDMKNVVEKLKNAGNDQIMLCERGTTFGYNNLVVDMTSLVEMRQLGFPIVFDATHSVQKPGGLGTATGGNREMIPYLMRAALAVGVDAIFAEVHPQPDQAISDAANQICLCKIREILRQAIAIDNVTKQLRTEITSENIEVNSPNNNNHQTPLFSNIKLLLSDVDGVMTDAGMYYSENGDELKRFNAHDGMGLQLIQKKGIKTGIVTSENTHIVERRFQKLKLDYLVQGKRDGGKLEAVREICKKENISLAEVAYIGDDVNCMELLSAVGVPACPINALPEIKLIPNIVHLQKAGGKGCVREFTELIMKSL